MTRTLEFRRHWRGNWLGCLREFADGDQQRRMWLDLKNRNPHWSYVEIMVCYFDDCLCGLGYDWAVAEGLVTQDEAAIIAPFHKLAEKHEAPGSDDFDHARILDDSAWQTVVAEAQSALIQLVGITKDQKEFRVLLGFQSE